MNNRYSMNLNKLKWILGGTLVLGVFLGLDIISEKVLEKRIEVFSKDRELLKTEEKNIFAERVGDSVSLYFFSRKGEKEIKDLETVGRFIDEYAILKKDAKFGIVNNKAEIKLPIAYDMVYLGKMKNVIYKEDNKFYKLNRNSSTRLYVEDLYQVNEESLIFVEDGKFGIMNFSGEKIISNEFKEISTSIGEYFVGIKNEKFSIYNLKNEKLTEDFDYIEQIGADTYKFGTSENAKFAFFNKNQKTDEIYEDIINLSEQFYLGITEDNGDIISVDGEIVSVPKRELEEYIERLLN
ncbi:MAG: hypothetical protein ACRC51_08825 [Cetobacterium sp.]